MVSSVTIGRGATVQEGGFAEIAPGQVRASVFNPTTQNLWAHTFSLIAGANGGASPNFRVGAWAANANREPSTRLGYSSQKLASTPMTSWDGGSYITAGVAVADGAPTNTAIPIAAGTRVALGPLPDAPLGIGMKAAEFISGADELRLFNRSGLSGTTPPNPFGSFDASVEGHLTVALICDTNDPPVQPVNRTVDTSTGTLTPTFRFDHRDRNGAWGPGNGGADRGDYLKAYRIQLRRKSDGQLLWNPAAFTANSAERAANQVSRKYTGTTLTAGTTYQWRIQTSDHFDEWYPWSESDWLDYTPPAAGAVTVTSPTGKQLTATPASFGFTWTHATGQAMQNVKVRIKQNGTVIRTSGSIAKSVANGASSSVTWAQTGFAALPWGGSFTTEMQAQDTGGNWTDWSGGKAFTTDAAPEVPGSLSPGGGAVVTNYPLLVCGMGDADDAAAGLTVTARIKNSAGAVLQTRTMTLRAGATRTWEYQTTSADLAAFGDFRWDASGFDGTLYSGETTVAGNRTWSDEASFTYAQGPVVTINSPADGSTITTSAPTVVWTVTNQATYQLAITDATTGELLYRSSLVLSTAGRAATLPSGIMANGGTYQLTVTVTDSNGLPGSASVTVTLQYTAPAALTGFRVDPVRIGTDPWPTTIRGSWEQSADPEFVKYRVYRDDLTVPYLEFTSATLTSFYDYTPESGREYTFTLVQVVLRDGIEEIESEPVQASATVNLGGVVLQSATDPNAYRAILTSVQDRTVTPTGEEAVYLTWAGGPPISFRGRTRYQTLQMTARITGDDQASAAQRQAELEAVEAWGGVVLYRDERGRKLFGKLPPNTLTTHDVRVRRTDVDLTLREEQWDEGVTS